MYEAGLVSISLISLLEELKLSCPSCYLDTLPENTPQSRYKKNDIFDSKYLYHSHPDHYIILQHSETDNDKHHPEPTSASSQIFYRPILPLETMKNFAKNLLPNMW